MNLMVTSQASFVLVILTLLVLAFVPSNATNSPAEIYWKTKMGNIPMPKTLKDSLQLGSNDGIVKLNLNYRSNFNFANQEHSATYTPPPPNSVNQGYPPAHTDIFYRYGNSVNSEEFKYGNPANSEEFKYAKPSNSKDLYLYTNPSNIHQIDIRNLFFYEYTLSRVGTKMKLRFKKMDNETKFLPLHVAKSMPTKSDKLQVILNQLLVNPKSILAQDIEMTMKQCEGKGIKDEKIYCATSLKGMIDYVTSILSSNKTNLVAVSTEVDDGIFMEYTIKKVQKIRSDGNHNMICHKKVNPYAVFYCHSIKSTDLYGVSFVGANGKQTKAVAVCHKDTSSWDPKNYAIQFVQSKPGGKPICHFITADAVVWFRK